MSFSMYLSYSIITRKVQMKLTIHPGLNGNGFNIHDKGFLFGEWRGEDNHNFLKRIILG